MANERSLAWYHANKHLVNKEEKKKYMQEYRLNNLEKWKRTPEQRTEINSRRREKYSKDKAHREDQKSKAREWQKQNPDKRKAQRIKKYGLTLPEFESMLEAQNNKCSICGYSDTSDPNLFPVVDHCHDTEKVRGLLCMSCNMGLGKFKDDVNVLKNAIRYLEENS